MMHQHTLSSSTCCFSILSLNCIQVIEARETEVQINVARNAYRSVASRGSMLFFLLNSLNKIHAFYQFSLNSFVTVRNKRWIGGTQFLGLSSLTIFCLLQVFSRGIDVAPGSGKSRKQKQITLEQISRRVTAQQLDFNTVMDMARRSSQMGGERYVVVFCSPYYNYHALEFS